jgi:hypothetical protein
MTGLFIFDKINVLYFLTNNPQRIAMLISLLMKGIASGFSLAAPGEAVGFLEIKETERSALTGKKPL